MLWMLHLCTGMPNWRHSAEKGGEGLMNCILCGVGGQGTVLASKLIAQSAMQKGKFARTAETIGMAQRGGSVVSHVRTGDQVPSPLIPEHEADVLIGFEPAEAVRTLRYLKKDGTVVVNTRGIQPVTASLTGKGYPEQEMLDYLCAQVSRIILVDGEKICNQCGSAKVLNVALLGAAAQAGVLDVTLAEMEQAIRERVNARFIDMNLNALRLGADAAKGK